MDIKVKLQMLSAFDNWATEDDDDGAGDDDGDEEDEDGPHC